MKNSINKSIKCALGLVVVITLIFIVVMIVFMECFSAKQGESRPVYDALYIGGTFFGGFATLTAAYIASNIFGEWKHERRYLNKKEQIDRALDIIELLDADLDMYHKNTFNDLRNTRRRVFQLCDLVFNLKLSNDITTPYLVKHSKVANIIPMPVENNRELSKDEKYHINRYHFAINKLGEELHKLKQEV